MTNRIAITMPLPDRVLSPNARCHWARKAKATKAARQMAKLLAMQQNPQQWRAARVRCSFTFRDRRRRDRDNLLASLKSVFDGLADAGVVINDSQLTHEPVRILEPNAKATGVLIEVWNESEGE